MFLRYTPTELENILRKYGLVSLHELAAEVSRSPYGIALKMRELSEQEPYRWNPEKVAEYTREEIKKHKGDVKAQKRRWRARKYRTQPVNKTRERMKRYRETNEGMWKEFGNYLGDLLILPPRALYFRHSWRSKKA